MHCLPKESGVAIYIQGLSALAYYRNGGSAIEVERTSQKVRSLDSATSSIAEILDAKIWILGIGEPTEGRPLEILVRNASQRTRSRAVHAKVWTGPIASTSFRTARKDLYVSSPEFVFLQLANRFDLPELVAIGMELCGTYRHNVELPRFDGIGITLTTSYQQPPLTNLRRLHGFIDSMKSAPGQPKALKALQYVLPNSASPMETALYLLLCLPRRLGGYALPKPILNPPIAFSKSGHRHTLKDSAKPDLYWKDARLDLEYDSGEFHDESNRAVDSMRRKALERMNVEVIELTPEELFSVDLFHATAARIAKRLSRRIRSEQEGTFLQKRSELRQALLLDNPTAPPHFEDDYSSEQDLGSSKAWEECDDAELPDDTIWVDEIPDEESYSDIPQDGDESWDVDFVERDDEDPHVFGRQSQED